jgi:DNA-binding GntR family transcriptional regulator
VNEDSDVGLAEAQPGGRLSDLAYTRILENLFDRRLPTGAFVSQNDLVKLLGIPVAPLRDALRVLEAEGILAIHPRSGIQFVKPGLELNAFLSAALATFSSSTKRPSSCVPRRSIGLVLSSGRSFRLR